MTDVAADLQRAMSRLRAAARSVVTTTGAGGIEVCVSIPAWERLIAAVCEEDRARLAYQTRLLPKLKEKP